MCCRSFPSAVPLCPKTGYPRCADCLDRIAAHAATMALRKRLYILCKKYKRSVLVYLAQKKRYERSTRAWEDRRNAPQYQQAYLNAAHSMHCAQVNLDMERMLYCHQELNNALLKAPLDLALEVRGTIQQDGRLTFLPPAAKAA
jgi:hypothetical protein